MTLLRSTSMVGRRVGLAVLAILLMVSACASPAATGTGAPPASIGPTPVPTPNPLTAVRHPMSDFLQGKRLVKTFTVGGRPDWQVFSDGALWVATGDDSHVVRETTILLVVPIRVRVVNRVGVIRVVGIRVWIVRIRRIAIRAVIAVVEVGPPETNKVAAVISGEETWTLECDTPTEMAAINTEAGVPAKSYRRSVTDANAATHRVATLHLSRQRKNCEGKKDRR